MISKNNVLAPDVKLLRKPYRPETLARMGTRDLFEDRIGQGFAGSTRGSITMRPCNRRPACQSGVGGLHKEHPPRSGRNNRSGLSPSHPADVCSRIAVNSSKNPRGSANRVRNLLGHRCCTHVPSRIGPIHRSLIGDAETARQPRHQCGAQHGRRMPSAPRHLQTAHDVESEIRGWPSASRRCPENSSPHV